MNFHNAREFQNVSLYFNKNGDLTEADIQKHHKEHVLIGGLNGTGKSTIALVFMSILNAPSKDVSPEDLISSYQNYTREEPWRFKGYILFYNDGALEDYSQFIKIVARFRGYTKKIGDINRHYIEEKVFEIYDSNSLFELDKINPIRFSNGAKYNPLRDFDVQLEKLGISPKKFLLYWKQGATNKFTAVNHGERFDKFASMLRLDKRIIKLDKMEEEHLKRNDELEKLAINVTKLSLGKKEIRVEADKKIKRDEALKRKTEDLFGSAEALDDFANTQVKDLSSSLEFLNNEIEELQESFKDLSNKLENLVTSIASIEKDIEETDKNKSEAEKEYDKIRAQFDEVSKWLTENATLYESINNLINELESEDLVDSKNLSISKVARMLNRITNEVVKLEEGIKSKKEQQDKILVDLSETRTNHKSLEERIDGFKKSIILANQIIEENPSEHELTANVKKSEEEILKINNDLQKLTEKKEGIIATVAAYQAMLEKANINIRTDLNRVRKDIGDKNSFLEDRTKERETTANKYAVCISKIEGMSLEEFNRQVDYLKSEHSSQVSILENAQEQFRNRQDKLQKVYMFLDTAIQNWSKENKELHFKINSLSSILKSKEEDIVRRSKQKEEVTINISKISLTIEEYEDKINTNELKRNEVDVELLEVKKQKKSAEKELEGFKSGLFRSVEEDEDIDDNSYLFYDVFQLMSKDLDESRELEKRLTLIKNAIFVDARNTQLKPKSQKYHIPLKEFKGFAGDLPFGLIVNNDVPKDIALRASDWLMRISMHIDEDGIVRDSLGVRGFKEEQNQFLVLNKILKEWTIKNIEEKIEKYEKKILLLSNQKSSIGDKVLELRTECDKLKSYLVDLNRINNEIELLSKEVEELNEDIEINFLYKRDLEKDLESLSPLYKLLSDEKKYFSLKCIGKLGNIKEDIIKDKEALLMEIPLFKKNIEDIDHHHKNIVTLLKELEKTQQLKDFFIKTRDEAIEIKKTIDMFSAYIEELSSQVDLLSDERIKLEKWEEKTENNLNDIVKYFGEVESVGTEEDYSIDDLLDKTNNTYQRQKVPLNKIEKDLDESDNRILSVQESLLKVNDRLLKVRNANEDLKKKEELEKLKVDNDLLKANISKLEAQENITKKAIEDLGIKFEDNKLKQEHFQKYLDKWDGIDWEFYDKYNVNANEKNFFVAQLVPLADNKDKLKDKLYSLKETKSNIEYDRNILSTTLQTVESVILNKNEEKKSLEIRIQGYLGQLRISFEDDEGYHGLVTEGNFEEMTLRDYTPTFKAMYLIKFSRAIEENYVYNFSSFEQSLNLPFKAILGDDDFRIGLRSLKAIFAEIIQTLRENVNEDAEKKYQLISEQYDKTIMDKECTETEVAKNESLVKSTKQEIEGLITSSVNIAQTILNEKLDKLGYIVRLEYVPKDSINGSRQLKLYFSKSIYGSTQLREIKSDEGMSGGEHAAVSLMIMYAIMKVKEKMEKGIGRQGGYLLLDEWDANLDPVNSRIIFNFLEELGKKIISITPRGNYEEYLEKFGVLIRVAHIGKTPMVAMINRDNEVQVREMIKESKLGEASIAMNQ